MGGIIAQSTLTFKELGDVQKKKKKIIDRIKVLGRYNNYIISSSHEITSDCKKENFLTLLKTLENYKEALA